MAKNKFWIIVILTLVFILTVSGLFAFRGRGGYHWHGGHWYHYYGPHWFGFDVAVSALTIGAVVETLPPGYTTFIVGGAPYYCYDSLYYRPIPEGFVVVQPPVIAASNGESPVPTVSYPPPAFDENQARGNEKITINVPNSKGGFTPVTLKKYKNGYIGPQGEYYEGNPTIAQLKVLYGK
jgi:hypothetical protein